MNNRNIPAAAVPQRSVCKRICYSLTRENISYGATQSFSALMGYGSGIPNMQYAMTFPLHSAIAGTTPSQVNFNWLIKLPAAAMIGAAYNGICTFLISGTFGYRFMLVAKSVIESEIRLFRQRKNTKRFLTETTMAFLSGVSGGAISSTPYDGVVKAVAFLVGFTTVFALSFIGLCELIIKLTDEDYSFRLKIIDHLKRISPRYQAQVQEFLQGKELNAETLPIFLKQVLDLAVQREAQEEARDLVFREKTKAETRKEYGLVAADYAISATLTGGCSFMYIPSGFGGVDVIFNALFNTPLENLSNSSKIGIGTTVGLPMMLFLFFTLKLFHSPLVELFPKIKDDVKSLVKAFSLIAVSAGNAAWLYGLAKSIADTSSILPFLAKSDYGQIVFPWAAYLTCLMVGTNGLTPMFLPSRINMQHPRVDDVIKSLKHNIFPADVIQGLKNHSYFTKDSKLPSLRSIEVEVNDDKKLTL